MKSAGGTPIIIEANLKQNHQIPVHLMPTSSQVISVCNQSSMNGKKQAYGEMSNGDMRNYIAANIILSPQDPRFAAFTMSEPIVIGQHEG